jgi:hypothetical protein
MNQVYNVPLLRLHGKDIVEAILNAEIKVGRPADRIELVRPTADVMGWRLLITFHNQTENSHATQIPADV